MSKRAASLVTIAMALAILAPLHPSLRGEYGDSFPFSWYPMFSRPRPDPERSVYVAGFEADGTRQFIPSRFYARGTMNQARRQLQDQMSRPESAQALCERVAEQIAHDKNRRRRRIETVRLVRGWFDTQEYFSRRQKEPLREQVFAECQVSRPGSDEPAQGSAP